MNGEKQRHSVLHVILNYSFCNFKKMTIYYTNTTVYWQGENIIYLNFHIFINFSFCCVLKGWDQFRNMCKSWESNDTNKQKLKILGCGITEALKKNFISPDE